MNIFCVDSFYAQTLRDLGHSVLDPDLPPGLVHLPSLLRRYDFEPDLLIQQERLAPRLLFSGLEEIACPTAFISIDAHLNMFWHKYYVRLFDVLFTPHISLFASLDRRERPPQTRRFAPAGQDLPFRAHAARKHALSFAGVLTEHRPSRLEMVRLLSEKCGLYQPEGILGQGDMLDLFCDSRLIPNESIALEVNFRLFEGLSCGALVLGQDLGSDQDAFFEPGLEYETYSNAIELLEKIEFYLKRPQASEKIARAGWKRIQEQYLPAHRAGQLLQAAGSARSRAAGQEGWRYLWLALAQLTRSGTVSLPVDWFLGRLDELREDSLVEAMRLRLLLEGAHPENILYSREQAGRYMEEAYRLTAVMLRSGAHETSLECNLAGSMASVVLHRPDWARAFWLRQLKSRGLPEGVSAASADTAPSPGYYLAWGNLLFALRRYAQVGFSFNPRNGHLPQCAFECLLLALEEGAEQRDLLPAMLRVCGKVPAFSYLEMGFLAEMSLLREESWNFQLLYGAKALENYRVEAGLYEIGAAREKALLAGNGDEFKTALEALPASAYIFSALDKF
ncbi:MAG: glycosyltransferase [Deltaproteobacteria bacterium]|jgi:hypothetical protein|nr:glycosyltransferase [Deltaproteobacteria bacterium]